MQELTIALPDDLLRQLQEFAHRAGTKESALVTAALEAYFEGQTWQVKEIEQGLREANEGIFVEQEEVEARLRRFIR